MRSEVCVRGRRPGLTTDTLGMKLFVVQLGAVILAAAVTGGIAGAGGPCGACRAGGTPYDGTGCGPKVYGPVREPFGPIDQCDACARFRGCNGYRQLPEMLAPWQLPPGRGFQPPEAFGYHAGPCDECESCGPRGGWPRLW